MSSDVAVRFDGVWKRYERFAASRLHHNLAFWLGGGKRETFWALEDVNFTVPRGQIFGVIGANGSGKSTALKIMAGITAPDRGTAEVRGRVGCLIEVGAGFDFELTGRENVYLNGTLHGMRRREIDKAFDAIVDFAGVHAFIDTPVKKYSSGMLMRLGFSVAMHTRPDVMLIDEVIAVGDAEFQKKCMDYIRQFCRDGGTAVVVSHQLWTMEEFCSRTLWLERGRNRMCEDTKETVAAYKRNAEAAPARDIS